MQSECRRYLEEFAGDHSPDEHFGAVNFEHFLEEIVIEKEAFNKRQSARFGHSWCSRQ